MGRIGRADVPTGAVFAGIAQAAERAHQVLQPVILHAPGDVMNWTAKVGIAESEPGVSVR
jgi:hypothetical protein